MSQPQQARPEPTEIAGRYQVVKKLGAGAFGTVYKARDKVLGRMVAIKTIRLEGLAAAGASIEELMDRFQREAQVSAQLKHPNIVTIYDIGEKDGLSYLAMEFIDGVGLERVIAEEKRLSVERAASLGAQVADALDFAHKHNVVHRDIKPANIMVEAGDRVKVTDFGIAKVTNAQDHLTVTGTLLGTPSYMSPEQARGLQIDGRSDLFAVGCVIYEMVTGRKAFRGESITGLIFKIITEEPPPITDPEVPPELVRIITRALAKTPEGRYQNGAELAADLKALTQPSATPTIRQAELATTPMPAPPAPDLPALPTQVLPSTQVAPPTAAGRPPAATAPVIAARPAARPSPAPPKAPPPPPARRSNALAIVLGLLALGVLGLAVVGFGLWQWQRGRSAPPAATLASAPASMAPAAAAGVVGQPAPGEAPGTAEAPAGTPVADAGTAPAAGAPAVPQPPPVAAPPQTRPAPAAPPPTEPAPAAPPAGAPPGAYAYLDQEEDDAGARPTEAFRRRGSSYGVGGRARERSPRGLGMAEIPAVATLRHLINAELRFNERQGRYGTLAELTAARDLRLDVPVTGGGFSRKGYRFSLRIQEDGFLVEAEPLRPGLRAFAGDDTGFIEAQ